ncbi:MAG: helix-turn-helix domain-containing protein [Sphaerochaetaceae bacterium]
MRAVVYKSTATDYPPPGFCDSNPSVLDARIIHSRIPLFCHTAGCNAVKPQTLRQWVRYKKIPFVKIGSAIRFRLQQLEKFIQNSAR